MEDNDIERRTENKKRVAEFITNCDQHAREQGRLKKDPLSNEKLLETIQMCRDTLSRIAEIHESLVADGFGEFATSPIEGMSYNEYMTLATEIQIERWTREAKQRGLKVD